MGEYISEDKSAIKHNFTSTRRSGGRFLTRRGSKPPPQKIDKFLQIPNQENLDSKLARYNNERQIQPNRIQKSWLPTPLPRIEEKYLVNQTNISMPTLIHNSHLMNIKSTQVSFPEQRPLSPLPDTSGDDSATQSLLTISNDRRLLVIKPADSSQLQPSPPPSETKNHHRRQNPTKTSGETNKSFTNRQPLEVSDGTTNKYSIRNRRNSSINEGNLRRASRIIDRMEQHMVKELEAMTKKNESKKSNIYEEVKYCRYLRNPFHFEGDDNCLCNNCEKLTTDNVSLR